MVGVNLSGLEFAPSGLPGVINDTYIEPTHGEIDYYAAKGMNVIRLPFLWERLQPVQRGPLDRTRRIWRCSTTWSPMPAARG